MKLLSLLCFVFLFTLNDLNAQCNQSNQAGIHIVQKGETLYQIASRYKVSVGDICYWNTLTLNEPIPICTKLKVSNSTTSSIPQDFSSNSTKEIFFDKSPTDISAYKRQAGNRHKVQAGEKMAGLAELYGYTEARFRKFNAMGPTEEVTTGSILLSTDCNCGRISFNDSDNGATSNTRPTAFNTDANNNSGNTNNTSNNNTTGTPAPSKASASFMTSVELSMVDEINMLRENPAGYISHVQAYVQEQKNNNGFPVNQSVVDELIRELRNTPKLSTLSTTPCLYQAAKKHGDDILRMGKSDHVGTDGAWPWDRVMRECPQMSDGNENLVGGPAKVRTSVVILLIDEGIPNRGHRKTLLNPKWTHVATHKIGQVGGMPNSWVQKFGASKTMNSNNSNTSSNNTSNNTTNDNSNTTSNTNNTSTAAAGKASASYMTSVELTMVDEINMLRANPSGYVSYIQAYVQEQKNNNGFPINQSVVDELIRELRNTPKLSTLSTTDCIYRAAKKHGDDILRMGKSDHVGTDGAWPWDRVKRECPQMSDGNENLVGGPSTVRASVIILLIDEGIPNRGHRKTLLNPKWKYVATHKIGQVGDMPNSWVQKFGS